MSHFLRSQVNKLAIRDWDLCQNHLGQYMLLIAYLNQEIFLQEYQENLFFDNKFRILYL